MEMEIMHNMECKSLSTNYIHKITYKPCRKKPQGEKNSKTSRIFIFFLFFFRAVIKFSG